MKLFLFFVFALSTGCANQMNSDQDVIGQHRTVTQTQTSSSTCDSPKYIDQVSQQYVQNEIQSGIAHINVKFDINCDGIDSQKCTMLGDQAIKSYLASNSGVTELRSSWPDWAIVSVTVNRNGLNKTLIDCSVKTVEADQLQFPQ